ncbi:MAG TPA: antibiotic biosynthesis monooxygenase family protein [Methanomicrobiales archaeon]|jgi:heme-degrading monooxygenase HmoA|nr:antibiotic biosynthesis monooxygenase family protein [Methanomicrobiales archaeon]
MEDHDAIFAAGIWDVRPGNEKAFIEAWKEFSAWTALRQKGSGYGNLLQDMDNPSRFISFGPWDDLESVKAWRQQPEFRKAIIRFTELCDRITPGTFRLVAGEGGEEEVWIPGHEVSRDRPGGKGDPLDSIPGHEVSRDRPGGRGREAAPPVQGGGGPSGPEKGAPGDRIPGPADHES